ncbi:MAG: hypothetical protein IMZ65_00880 [Planctomycetes bacterium]|nr:hypothetical protein [Planctomycetota bacterium]
MREDPIVAEVRKHRQKRAAKFKYDIQAMLDDARKREPKSGHPIVSPRRREKAKSLSE